MTPPRPGSFAPGLPFKYLAGNPALDLINTVDWTSRGPDHDRLSSYVRLIQWGAGAGILTPDACATLRARARAHPGEAEAALGTAWRIRWLLWKVFGAVARGEPAPDALGQLNRTLARVLPRLQVTGADARARRATRLRLGWREMGTHFESVLWPVLWAGASLLVSGEADRIKICGGTDCGWMYVDHSRNGLRRWCEMETCGTLEKSRRRYLRSRRSATSRGSRRRS